MKSCQVCLLQKANYKFNERNLQIKINNQLYENLSFLDSASSPGYQSIRLTNLRAFKGDFIVLTFVNMSGPSTRLITDKTLEILATDSNKYLTFRATSAPFRFSGLALDNVLVQGTQARRGSSSVLFVSFTIPSPDVIPEPQSILLLTLPAELTSAVIFDQEASAGLSTQIQFNRDSPQLYKFESTGPNPQLFSSTKVKLVFKIEHPSDKNKTGPFEIQILQKGKEVDYSYSMETLFIYTQNKLVVQSAELKTTAENHLNFNLFLNLTLSDPIEQGSRFSLTFLNAEVRFEGQKTHRQCLQINSMEKNPIPCELKKDSDNSILISPPISSAHRGGSSLQLLVEKLYFVTQQLPSQLPLRIEISSLGLGQYFEQSRTDVEVGCSSNCVLCLTSDLGQCVKCREGATLMNKRCVLSDTIQTTSLVFRTLSFINASFCLLFLLLYNCIPWLAKLRSHHEIVVFTDNKMIASLSSTLGLVFNLIVAIQHKNLPFTFFSAAFLIVKFLTNIYVFLSNRKFKISKAHT
jgi:hypothetical protein